MASKKTETAMQEFALACHYNRPERAAAQLKQIAGEQAPRMLRGALRQLTLVMPFVRHEEIVEELGKVGLAIATKTEEEKL